MEKFYLSPKNASLEVYQKIRDRKLEPYCATCQAKLSVHRLRGEPDGPVTSIRCPIDVQHFMRTYRVENPEMDELMRADARESEDD